MEKLKEQDSHNSLTLEVINVSVFVPKQRSRIALIAEKFGIAAKIIEEYWGIADKPVASYFDDQVSLACKAIRKLDIPNTTALDSIIFCTSQYPNCGNAFQIARKIGATKSVRLSDIAPGCSGFIEALNLAHDQIVASKNINTILICSGERNRFSYRNIDDLRFLPFGDAGGAVLLRRITSSSKSKLERGLEIVISNPRIIYHNKIAGNMEIIRQGYSNILRETLLKMKLVPSDIDLFLLTQSPVKTMNKIASDILNTDMDKIPISFTRLGHLGNIDHILLLSQYMRHHNKPCKCFLLGNSEIVNGHRFASAIVTS